MTFGDKHVPPLLERKRRPRGRPKDPTLRERILAGACEHFGEFGFERSNMERIAALADVSKVTLYRYFPSKQALFDAVVNEPLRRVVALDVVALDPANPRAALLKFAETYAELATSSEVIAHLRVRYGNVVSHPSTDASYLASGPEALIHQLEAYLRTACRKGSLKIVDVAQAAEQFAAMVCGTEQSRMLMGQACQRDAVARRRYCKSCVNLFMCGYGRGVRQAQGVASSGSRSRWSS